MCDLLWSDPQPQVSSRPRASVRWRFPFRAQISQPCVLQNGRSVSKRGVSCQFGPDVTESFLEKNKLDYIIRSHEVKAEGYEVTHSGKCITVFSAPNYWYVRLTDSCRRPGFLFLKKLWHFYIKSWRDCFLLRNHGNILLPVIRWEIKELTSTSGDQTSSQNFTSSQLWLVCCFIYLFIFLAVCSDPELVGKTSPNAAPSKLKSCLFFGGIGRTVTHPYAYAVLKSTY